MKKILITGGSGLIGQRLTELLLAKKVEVVWLTRNAGIKNNVQSFEWNPDKLFADKLAFNGVDAIVNLAGAGVVDKRWTTTRKNEIISSRVNAAQTLFNILSKQKHQVKAIVNSSAIGFYGNQVEKNIDETQKAIRKDFLAETCLAWESAAHQFKKLNIRTTILRTGIVLSTKGGALKEMLMSFKFFTGTYFGNGSMYMSWIHIDDMCNMIIYALENDNIQGTFNAVAPNPVTNKELSDSIGKIKHALIEIPIPVFVLKLILGARVETVIQNLHASSHKIIQAGFKYKYEKVEDALKNLLR